jgi:PAS domain S-box-containing protein
MSSVTLVFLLIVVGITISSDRRIRTDEVQKLEYHLNDVANARSRSFVAGLERIKRDASFLAGTPPISGIIRASQNSGIDPFMKYSREQWSKRLNDVFAAYLTTHPAVYQLRFIGVADGGRELVRVDRRDGVIVPIDSENLQRKADRKYFKEVLKRKYGEVYVSEMTLNRERGEVEIPHTPTLRVGLAVFDVNREVFGVLVINISLIDIFASLEADFNSGEIVYILNPSDDYLLHSDPSKTFGFEFNRPLRWSDEYIALEKDGGETVYQRDDGERFYFSTRDVYYDSENYMKLAVGASEGIINDLVERARVLRFYPLLGLFFLTQLVAYLIVMNIRRRDYASRKTASLAAIVAGSNDAIISESMKGIVSSWNRSAEKMFGYTAIEALGKPLNSLIVPLAYEGEISDSFKKVAAGEKIPNFETVRCHHDGEEMAVSVTMSPVLANDGKIVGVANIIRDIRDMKFAQSQLLQLNESLEAKIEERTRQLDFTSAMQEKILSSAGYAIFANTPDGIFTLFNPAAEKLLGYRSDEMVYKENISIIFDPVSFKAEMKEMIAKNPVEIVDKENPYFTLDINHEKEWFFIRRDGSKVPVLLKSNTLYDKNNQVLGYLGIALDLSEQKRQQKELMDAKAVAEEASQSKSDFLANMSHEIRTPMNAVLGMLNLLKFTEMTAKQADYVTKAGGAAEALLGIINDILDFSKIEAGKMSLDIQPFAIEDVLRDIAVILNVSLGDKNLEILFKIDPKVPMSMLGDSLRIKQILLNLASNAVKFTQKGEVALSVFIQHEQSDSLVLGFSVRDSGIGMNAEQLQRIFDSFTQAEAGTTRRFGGTGLGLVISRRLIRLMGGELEVESELGKGSNFTFSLSLQKVAGQQGLESLRGRLPPRFKNKRILVVDDNASARQITCEICESFGWSADEVDSGKRGLVLVEQSILDHTPYDIVFIDWKMPEMDGWETANAIRGLTGSGLPRLVMVTGHAKEVFSEQIDSENVPLDGFLMKPVTASDIFDAAVDALSDQIHVEVSQLVAGKAASGGLAGMRVLLVEDNLTNQQVASELLGMEGADVEVAGNGLIALACIREASLPFDAVLMDLQMPVMDGFTATAEIRNTLGLKDLPVIAMTANAMPADRAACLAAGMSEHVGKPFDLSELVAILQGVVGRGGVVGAGVVDTSSGEAVPQSPPGFAFNEALLRMGNSRSVYAAQAKIFAKRHCGDLNAVRDLLDRGETAGVVRGLHTLRGVSATLGAKALALTLSETETAVKGGADGASVDSMLASSEVLLQEACQVFAALSESLEPASSASVEENSLSIDDDEVRAQLDEFESLLKESNMRALDIHNELKAVLAAADSDNVLADAMAGLDFVGAYKALQAIRSE